MRHNTVNDNETPLASGTKTDRPRGSDLTPEALDRIMSRARQMRAEAIAQLFSRLGNAIVGVFRHSAPSKHARSTTAINREPHGAV